MCTVLDNDDQQVQSLLQMETPPCKTDSKTRAGNDEQQSAGGKGKAKIEDTSESKKTKRQDLQGQCDHDVKIGERKNCFLKAYVKPRV